MSRSPRPLTVSFLAAGVLLVAILNGTRAAWLWQRREFLATLIVSVPLAYLVGSAIVWCAIWCAAGIGLWRMARWGRTLTAVAVVLYHAHNWINRWLFEVSEFARLVWPWQALVTIISIALTYGILWRPRVRRRFTTSSLE
ncbi:MAG: hypothetical protein ACE5FI_02585 [Anaerolineales bacterium]